MTQVIGADQFNQLVLEAQGPVLVDFFATWCGPCKRMAPALDQVADEVAGRAAVYKVDIDEDPQLAQQFDVMAVPTLVVFENGQVKTTAQGAQTKAAILDMLQ